MRKTRRKSERTLKEGQEKTAKGHCTICISKVGRIRQVIDEEEEEGEETGTHTACYQDVAYNSGSRGAADWERPVEVVVRKPGT